MLMRRLKKEESLKELKYLIEERMPIEVELMIGMEIRSKMASKDLRMGLRSRSMSKGNFGLQ